MWLLDVAMSLIMGSLVVMAFWPWPGFAVHVAGMACLVGWDRRWV